MHCLRLVKSTFSVDFNYFFINCSYSSGNTVNHLPICGSVFVDSRISIALKYFLFSFYFSD